MVKLYKVTEVASMLGLSASCLYKKTERGEIQTIKIGSALRFTEEGIQNFLEKCKLRDAPVYTQNLNYDPWDVINS